MPSKIEDDYTENVLDYSEAPFYTKESDKSSPYEIVFWMCIVASLMLVIYLRVTRLLDLDWVFIIYSLAVSFTILARYVFYHLFTPQLLSLGAWTPSVQVILPCMNESDRVYKTAKSLYNQDYPKDKLSVIIVNDGSTDDTDEWLLKINQDFGWSISTLPSNQGKRAAIAEGMKNNKSEITVLMDSDVILSSNSISEIVRGFSGYNVAAVCGNTSVANETKNILTRVQSQYYYISYRTFKSSEAYFRTVLCCNGCFSAYRSDRLFSVMDEWQTQTFLGTKRTFSDDRSLTNLLLKEGWDTVYHPGAKSSTYVPEKLSDYINQQTRWRKGFFIESVYALKSMWRRPFGGAFLFYMNFFLGLMVPVVLGYYILINPISHGVNPFGYVGAIFMITLLHQIFFLIFREADALNIGYLALITAVPLWTFAAIILIPLALLTIKGTRWLTRSHSSKIE